VLPVASLNTPALTSIEVAPSALAVKVAVYTVELEEAKLLRLPPVTVISPTAKFVVASLEVKVNAIDASLDVSPLLTVELVIVIVGDVLSTETLPEPLVTAVPAFPRASVKAIE
tara:strand:- start:54 stop:395 length:342 start_codon:yes stop_codon:yes gene_type:complete